MKRTLHVYSEIGKLRTVLLHRPGEELLNLTPDTLEELLFDDIPYLKRAREEHDAFADTLRRAGVEVLYLDKLMSEAIKEKEVRRTFIDTFVKEAGLKSEEDEHYYHTFLSSIEDELELVHRTMAGARRVEVPGAQWGSIKLSNVRKHFFVKPMPNLYFTRDPFAVIGHGVSVNNMWSDIRDRETIYGRYIFRYHEDFKDSAIPWWYTPEERGSIEGGDELILSKDVVAIGISQRTSPMAIERIASRLLSDGDFSVVLAVEIPKKRAFMHLDTVFTMIDKDLFTVHPEISDPISVHEIRLAGGKIRTRVLRGSLAEILATFLDVPRITLLPCGGFDPVDAEREQWSDGSNTLAIAPREVIVYDRNEGTNRILREYGVKLHEVPSSELSRGRGGPRCMSMPLVREDI